jgi:hypothetical protein
MMFPQPGRLQIAAVDAPGTCPAGGLLVMTVPSGISRPFSFHFSSDQK